MSIANQFMNQVIFKDDKHIVFNDFSVIDKNNNKVYDNTLNLTLNIGFTSKKKNFNNLDLYNIVNKDEKESEKSYKAPFLTIDFPPQTMAEGCHRSMYIMHNGDVLIEEFDGSGLIKEKDIEVLYDTNIKGIAKWLNKKFNSENEKKLGKKMRIKN
jgi:hypothetical protein